MTHPEDEPVEVSFLRQSETTIRLSIRMARKIIREEAFDTVETGSLESFQDDESKIQMANVTLGLAAALAERMSNISGLLLQANPTSVQNVFDATERVVNALRRELTR